MVEGDELGGRVRAARAGDGAAQRDLYDQFSGFVSSRLRGLKAKRNWFWMTDMEELTQDVFVLFFKALENGRFVYRDGAELEGFLVRSAFFAAMNAKDRRPREPTSQLVAEDQIPESFSLHGFSEQVYQHLERRDCMRLLGEAVERLSSNRRDVVRRLLLGHKVRDICAATGRTASSVSGLKFNALKELKAILDADRFLERCAEAMHIFEGRRDD